MTNLTIRLKERFCKDMDVPINIFEEPYFTKRLNILDNFCKDKKYGEKYRLMLEMLKDFNTEQDYFEYYNSVKDKAIESIKSTAGWFNFNLEDMNDYKNHIKETHENLYKEIYNEEVVNGKLYTSIDISSANFSALKHYNPAIFNNKDNWKDFLGQFTKYEYILNSKYIRQVILGNCNPSRCITYVGWLAEKILKMVEEACPNAKLVCFTTDELIFDIPSDERIKLINIEERVQNELGIKITQEFFKLRKIVGDVSGYLRDEYDYKEKHIINTEYKCLDKNFAYLTICLLNKQEFMQDSDYVFSFEGKLAKLVNNPKVEIKSL